MCVPELPFSLSTRIGNVHTIHLRRKSFFAELLPSALPIVPTTYIYHFTISNPNLSTFNICSIWIWRQLTGGRLYKPPAYQSLIKKVRRHVSEHIYQVPVIYKTSDLGSVLWIWNTRTKWAMIYNLCNFSNHSKQIFWFNLILVLQKHNVKIITYTYTSKIIIINLKVIIWVPIRGSRYLVLWYHIKE